MCFWAQIGNVLIATALVFHCSSQVGNSGRFEHLCAVITDKTLKQQKNTEAIGWSEFKQVTETGTHRSLEKQEQCQTTQEGKMRSKIFHNTSQ